MYKPPCWAGGFVIIFEIGPDFLEILFYFVDKKTQPTIAVPK